MAEILLGPDANPTDIRRIAHDADGNPLFVEELAAALGTTGVPQTVRDLMLARFSVLDEHSRHLVRTAAVIGATAPQAWLAAAAGLGDNATRCAARAAVDRGLLIAGSDGTSYHFRHALLRQAVLDELLPDERVALHDAIAAALTAHPAVAVGIDRIAELARHWDAARDASSALRWLVAAAEQAEQRFAFEAAFDDYERALGWWDSVGDAARVAGSDHAALLLDAADAAGLAGHIGRAGGSRTGRFRRGVHARREPWRRSGGSRVPPALASRSCGRAVRVLHDNLAAGLGSCRPRGTSAVPREPRRTSGRVRHAGRGPRAGRADDGGAARGRRSRGSKLARIS